MAINTTETNIRLEAVNAYFGKKHCRKVATVADVADSLQDTYFDFNWISPEFEEVQGYVYFDTDPAVAGKTAVGPVARTSGDSAATIASNIASTINASVGFAVAEVKNGSEVYIENRAPFAITAEADSGSTGFTYTTLIAGSGAKLGKTAQGGSSISLEAQTAEIKSDQTAEILLDDISLGTSASIEMGIIELTKEQFQLLIGSAAGDVVDATNDVTGYGESRTYQSMKSLGGMLVLRPVRLDGEQDYTSDVFVPACAPLPQDINYSGSDVQTLNVTFKPYLDASINEKVNLIGFGDWTQDEVVA
jgi:hypothetical protein